MTDFASLDIPKDGYDAVIFDSKLIHQVTDVTSGRRMVLQAFFFKRDDYLNYSIWDFSPKCET